MRVVAGNSYKPMDPVEVRGLLAVGDLFEFEPALIRYGVTVSSWHILGVLRFWGDPFEFEIIAGEIPTLKYINIPVERFKSLKRVSKEDLPLYINWSKTEEFSRMLKGVS
jgi:hypothetical protein